MKFRFNCWLLALGCFTVCTLLLAGLAHGTIYYGCTYWHAWAVNAAAHNIETYIIAHGDNSGYYAGCPPGSPVVAAMDIPQSGFAFYGLCGAMNKTGPGTVSSRAMESIGYYHLELPLCDACWSHSLSWQDYLFRLHATGLPWSVAYDRSVKQFPECAPCTGYFNRSADIVQKILYPWLLK